MGLKDFFARQRQKANDKAVLDASIAEHDEPIVEETPTPKKRKSRKVSETENVFHDDVNIVQMPMAFEEESAVDKTSTKKSRRYKAKTKVVAQADDEMQHSSANKKTTKERVKKETVEETTKHTQPDDASDWKNRKKKKQASTKKTRPPLSMKQLLLSSVFVYGVLIAILLVQSFWVVRQSFLYRTEYQQLNQLNEKERQLNIEWGRMLIEKQTFGSSAQIATRATMEMGMFSPSREQRIIITLPENNTSSSPKP